LCIFSCIPFGPKISARQTQVLFVTLIGDLFGYGIKDLRGPTPAFPITETLFMSETSPSSAFRSSSNAANGPNLGPVNPEPLLKRPLDIMVALIGLSLSSPLWLAIAAAIKLEDGGPIFYTQTRWERGGIPFKAFKFRSMTADIDKVHGVRPANEQAAHGRRAAQDGSGRAAPAIEHPEGRHEHGRSARAGR
jgi:Bacterial sugar transferase